LGTAEKLMATETDTDAAARLAALRSDPAVVIHRPKARLKFEPTLCIEGPIDLRTLLGRDDLEEDVWDDTT
jgi:hypothetical protein